MLQEMFSNPVSVLFLVIAIGYAVGRITVFGISLGASAVLFVALVFGHFGMTIPQQISDLGVILFVYSIGLQAGPRFFSMFQLRGLKFAVVAFFTILVAALLTWAACAVLGIPLALAVGVFAGALTSTPGLAAAVDTLSDPLVSVGYGIAYPFGVVGVVLFVQIVPRILSADKDSAEGGSGKKKKGQRFHNPSKKFRVENSRCDGKTLAELDLQRMTKAVISRILHDDSVASVGPETVLHVGDVVLAVGPEEELAKLEWIFGPEVQQEMHSSKDVIARDVYVSENRAAGKTIAELHVAERFGVVVSRMSREEIELVPTGDLRLEIGDSLRVVGSPAACEAFVEFVGEHEKRVHETTIFPFCIGILLGVVLAYLPLGLPGGITFRLGLAGGPLFVGLLLGYYGGIGRLRLHTPYAVRYLLRELGLVFFLAGAGTRAGTQFLAVFQEQGGTLILIGAVITVLPLIFSFVLSRVYYRFDLGSSLGAVCGSMTSTPALGALCTSMDSDEPALAYTAVYPIALIAVTVAAQLLCLF